MEILARQTLEVWRDLYMRLQSVHAHSEMTTLTICIPTYNRATLLIQALNAVQTQLTQSTSGLVNLLISDNASSDQTCQVVKNFAIAHPQVRLTYERQVQNLGTDASINWLIEHVSGDFAMILSDDDILLPGAIDRIFEVISTHPDIGALSLNANTFTASPNKLSAPIRPTQQDRLINDRDEVLIALGTWLTFISILVFRTNIINRNAYAQRIGTNFIQSYIFLDVLARTNGCWMTAEPYLAIRSNNTGGYDFFKVFVSDFASLLEHAAQSGFSARAVQQVLKNHEAFILSFVIAFKVHGMFGSLQPNFADGLKRIWRVYQTEPVFLLKITLLLLLPHSVVLRLRWVRRNLRRGL